MFTSPFQIMITAAWIISAMYNTPNITYMRVTNGVCYEMWPDDWKIKAFSLSVTTQVIIALVLMVSLYSRVIFALWFKRNGTDAVTSQQKVSADVVITNGN